MFNISITFWNIKYIYLIIIILLFVFHFCPCFALIYFAKMININCFGFDQNLNLVYFSLAKSYYNVIVK